MLLTSPVASGRRCESRAQRCLQTKEEKDRKESDLGIVDKYPELMASRGMASFC